MTRLTQRVFYHVVGRPFLRRLVWPIFVVLIVVTLADPMIDWNVLRQRITSLSPLAQASLFTGLFLGWGLTAGSALSPIWRQPMIGLLIRQPLTRWQWVFGLLPSLAIAFLPVFAIWWLAPHHTNSVAHYLGFVGLSWPIILGASYRRASSILVVVVGAISLTTLVFAYCYYPFVAYIAILVTIIQLPTSVALIPKQNTLVVEPKSRDLSSDSAVVALIRRDLRCLLRVEWKSLLNFALFSTVAPLMMFAFRVNGAMEGREALLAGCALFSLSASTIYESLEKMKDRLGKEFIRQRWPVTYSQRGLALIGLISIFIVPGGLLIGAIASSMGIYNLLLFILFIAVTISLYAALFSKLLRATTTSIGLLMLATLAHVLIVSLLPDWGYAVIGVPFIIVSFNLITAELRKFALYIERTTIDQLA